MVAAHFFCLAHVDGKKTGVQFSEKQISVHEGLLRSVNNANSSESKNKNKKQGMKIMGSTLMFRSSFYLFSLGSRLNLSVKIAKAGASLQFGWKKRKQRRMREEEETASDSRRVRNQDEEQKV